MNPKQAPTKQRHLPFALPEEKRSRLLPNLCQNDSLFFLILLTQILVIVYTLLQSRTQLLNFELLGLYSLFSHGLVLSCALFLCFYRTLFNPDSKLALIIHTTTVLATVSWAFAFSWSSFVSERFGLESHELFVQKTMLICICLGGVIIRYLYLQNQWHLQKNAEITARVEALQARIRPHFLFNSMNSIASLILSDPDRAEEAVLDLSELFRASLQTKQSMISFEDELSLCRRYIAIEKLRLGRRLSIQWEIQDSCHEVLVPQLTLQPVLENAIYHGIQPLTDGGTILIKAYAARKSLYIMVSNPFIKQDHNSHSGNQIAVENIRSRLSAIFGDDAVFKSSRQDEIYTVTMRIPMRSVK